MRSIVHEPRSVEAISLQCAFFFFFFFFFGGPRGGGGGGLNPLNPPPPPYIRAYDLKSFQNMNKFESYIRVHAYPAGKNTFTHTHSQCESQCEITVHTVNQCETQCDSHCE